MGLDMYLNRHTYVGNKHREKDQQLRVVIPKNQEGATFPIPQGSIKRERISYIVEEVGYWRKFNALHSWFVENVQDGMDDCRSTYCSKTDLEELLRVLEHDLAYLESLSFEENEDEDCTIGEFLEKPDLDKMELQPTTGFFFGSQEVDHWFLEDIKYSIPIIKEAIEDKQGSYYYTSSW